MEKPSFLQWMKVEKPHSSVVKVMVICYVILSSILVDDAEEGYMRVEKGDTRSSGQTHSSEDEGKGDVVVLYYPLFWWMMQRRGTGG